MESHCSVEISDLSLTLGTIIDIWPEASGGLNFTSHDIQRTSLQITETHSNYLHLCVSRDMVFVWKTKKGISEIVAGVILKEE